MYVHQIRINAHHPGFHLIGFCWTPHPLLHVLMCDGTQRGCFGVQITRYPGDILFIEDRLKDIATVECSFSMLKLNGIFDKVSAIILGKHELFNAAGRRHQPLMDYWRYWRIRLYR